MSATANTVTSVDKAHPKIGVRNRSAILQLAKEHSALRLGNGNAGKLGHADSAQAEQKFFRSPTCFSSAGSIVSSARKLMYAGNVTPARVLQHWPAFNTVNYARKSNSADGHEQAHSPAQHWSLLFHACSTKSRKTYATTFVSAKLSMMIRKVPGSKVN